ncbi:molybdenum cofactor biosynthesis protein MoaE [Zavarzinia sp.]|uniref:molybdenum cofactor biosynthesis protein MoaE n=1 Tax=Zavarzinia sp. TaxID=2027920 RepID=UPI0035645CD1
MIRVQSEDFDVGAELARLDQGPGVGAVASFVGLVRRHGDQQDVTGIALEHYPGMTERALEALEAEARKRFELADCLIIHRVGELPLGARIVLVAAASPHRQAALEATQFLIDRLKTDAPFWKREITAAGSQWVAAKPSDDSAASRWR